MAVQQFDIEAGELSRMLSSLQQSTFHAGPEQERRLRTDEFERAKLEANLSYARRLLAKLEQSVLSTKAISQRAQKQESLHTNREILEALTDTLHDFVKIASHDDDDEDELGDDDAACNSGLLAELTASFGDISGSTSDTLSQEPQDHTQSIEPNTLKPTPLPTQQSPSDSNPQVISTQTSQNLRERTPRTAAPVPSTTQISSPTPSTASTSNQTRAHTTARAALFANRRKQAPSTAAAQTSTTTATTEAILDHQRTEQDALSESILKMAGALKASSQQFSSTLEADKEALGRAGEGMDKTERGMEAAKGRMGALKRMTEGKGWWGRMMLFAWVYGLMVSLLLLVFVMPKLRF